MMIKLKSVGIKNYLMLIFFVMTFNVCSNNFSQEDLNRVELLRQQYAGQYRFALEDGLYLEVVAIDDKKNLDSLKEIYKSFFYDSFVENKKRKTTFVYLNFYDANENFQFQIHVDFNQQFKVGRSQYY